MLFCCHRQLAIFVCFIAFYLLSPTASAQQSAAGLGIGSKLIEKLGQYADVQVELDRNTGVGSKLTLPLGDKKVGISLVFSSSGKLPLRKAQTDGRLLVELEFANFRCYFTARPLLWENQQSGLVQLTCVSAPGELPLTEINSRSAAFFAPLPEPKLLAQSDYLTDSRTPHIASLHDIDGIPVLMHLRNMTWHRGGRWGNVYSADVLTQLDLPGWSLTFESGDFKEAPKLIDAQRLVNLDPRTEFSKLDLTQYHNWGILLPGHAGVKFTGPDRLQVRLSGKQIELLQFVSLNDGFVTDSCYSALEIRSSSGTLQIVLNKAEYDPVDFKYWDIQGRFDVPKDGDVLSIAPQDGDNTVEYKFDGVIYTVTTAVDEDEATILQRLAIKPAVMSEWQTELNSERVLDFVADGFCAARLASGAERSGY